MAAADADLIKLPAPGPATKSMLNKDERSMRQKLSDWYLVYELRTALYSLEPWEKTMFSEYLLLCVTVC